MPHDMNGHEVKVGQVVSIDFAVTAVTPGEDFCNVSLVAVAPASPDQMAKAGGAPTITCNTKYACVVRQPLEIVSASGS